MHWEEHNSSRIADGRGRSSLYLASGTATAPVTAVLVAVHLVNTLCRIRGAMRPLRTRSRYGNGGPPIRMPTSVWLPEESRASWLLTAISKVKAQRSGATYRISTAGAILSQRALHPVATTTCSRSMKELS